MRGYSSIMEQLSLFPEAPDKRAPVSVTWNLWHGCTRVSTGCKHCYMYRRDEAVGRDPSKVEKTKSFNLPVSRFRAGEYKGRFKVPAGSFVYTCFSSDFFHLEADQWRDDAWDMIRERSDCSFLIITKRPERIEKCLPFDWVLDVHEQCVEAGIGFYYHQTGARLLKDKKEYRISREHQHEQAKKAGLDR